MIIYFKYLNYVIRHKWFVFIECCKVGKIWRGIWHDMSKFRPDEFIPYARYFYGDWPDYNSIKKHLSWYPYKYTKEAIQEAFDLAWLKHQHRNPHHWQYWVLREDDGGTKLIDMKSEYVDEMLADWKGAGRAITGKNDPAEYRTWYLKNYNKIKLSENIRIVVDNLLDVWEDVLWKEIEEEIRLSTKAKENQ